MQSRERRSSSTNQNTDCKLPQPGNLDKALVQPQPQGAGSTIKRSHNQGHSKHSNLNRMKRQRNIQQVKEHDKCLPNQTKEEATGSLPEKEFRIMRVKMIQMLKTMELQINILETKTEKMQEMFNKDLEEIKKSQSIMNNAITETESTLEGTNSRITEAEDRISEVEDKMVEINEAQREREKN